MPYLQSYFNRKTWYDCKINDVIIFNFIKVNVTKWPALVVKFKSIAHDQLMIIWRHLMAWPEPQSTLLEPETGQNCKRSSFETIWIKQTRFWRDRENEIHGFHLADPRFLIFENLLMLIGSKISLELWVTWTKS